MTGPTAHDLVLDSLIENAIEVLVERAHGDRLGSDRLRSELHELHDDRAYQLLIEDIERGLTARGLADLLAPAPVPPSVPPRVEPESAYAEAERRRRARNAAVPDGWIAPDAFARCLADARAAMTPTTEEPTP